MFYLFLATLCSASIALIFKYTENSDTNRYVITSANYFMAFFASLIMIFRKGLFVDLGIRTPFLEELGQVFSSDNMVLSQYGSVIWGVLIGSVAGLFFFLSFIFYQKSVKENGVGLSGTFAKLGILVPMVFSIILWKELPSFLQWIGIVISICSILIVNLSKVSSDRLDFNKTLILLFLFGGMAEFSTKIYQKYGLNDYKDVFLFMVFLIAFFISTYYTLKLKSKIVASDIWIGFAVGIPNLFSSYFLILALDSLKTSIVFPLYSAGSIVLINIGGWLLYKEKISGKNKFAIVLTIIALVLINL